VPFVAPGGEQPQVGGVTGPGTAPVTGQEPGPRHTFLLGSRVGDNKDVGLSGGRHGRLPSEMPPQWAALWEHATGLPLPNCHRASCARAHPDKCRQGDRTRGTNRRFMDLPEITEYSAYSLKKCVELDRKIRCWRYFAPHVCRSRALGCDAQHGGPHRQPSLASTRARAPVVHRSAGWVGSLCSITEGLAAARTAAKRARRSA
jgi:hypothetical protein